MLALFGRMDAVLVQHDFNTTANYLEMSANQVVDLWIERVGASIPSHTPRLPESRDWGNRNTGLLVRLLRASAAPGRERVSASLLTAGCELASQHIQKGIPLHVLLKAQSLYRLSVLNTVERMLRSRLWIAFPQDIPRAEEVANEALDQRAALGHQRPQRGPGDAQGGGAGQGGS